MNDPNPDPKPTTSQVDLGLSLFWTLAKMWLLWAAVWLGVVGALLYVAIHFISKFW